MITPKVNSILQVAFGVPHDGDVWDFFLGKAEVNKEKYNGLQSINR